MRSSNAYCRHRRHSREHAGAASSSPIYSGGTSIAHRAMPLAPGRRTGHSRTGAFSHVGRNVAVIVRALTVLDENRGISTTAEGVEPIAQFTQLGRQGRSRGAGPLHQPDASRRRHRGAVATTGPWIRPTAGLPLSRKATAACTSCILSRWLAYVPTAFMSRYANERLSHTDGIAIDRVLLAPRQNRASNAASG
jgi:hypothetical protein